MSTTKQTVLAVEGMTCGSCVRHVQGALHGLAGVSTVLVHLRDGKAVVDHAFAGPSIGTLIEAGKRNLGEEQIRWLLAAPEGVKANPVAPARGLHLVRVFY